MSLTISMCCCHSMCRVPDLVIHTLQGYCHSMCCRLLPQSTAPHYQQVTPSISNFVFFSTLFSSGTSFISFHLFSPSVTLSPLFILNCYYFSIFFHMHIHFFVLQIYKSVCEIICSIFLYANLF